MRSISEIMIGIDRYLRGIEVTMGTGYSGWHDDHRHLDGTPAYMPALQQVRGEFRSTLVEILKAGLGNGPCLQLGLGPSGASRKVWRHVFAHVVSIDLAACHRDDWEFPGLNTHDPAAVDFADVNTPYDFLFIDAGHSYDDVAQDFRSYAHMVRRGGLIAFHDALPRERYPEIKVHEFIRGMPVTIFGDEVGTAVMEVK